MAMNREARTFLVVVLGTVLLAGGLLTACSSDTDNLSTPSGSHLEATTEFRLPTLLGLN